MSNKTLYLKPAEGLMVRMEDGTDMPAEGCAVPNNSYYRRRHLDGDLIVFTPTTATAPQES
ncbi:DUF2635 domain-containing protein [Aliamphritea spongicola]|uniref:DUF2635 domain-containing protein n=1 Tax=Aliamphritea spongicola TaxID=707589 RepID=UPI00196BA206|nr:DUF2635 domain-containing protein [Aliamphritea spongicola]MBN3562123.1 DUF2635 domain-containing protein [Aliamphritea spongicola]